MNNYIVTYRIYSEGKGIFNKHYLQKEDAEKIFEALKTIAETINSKNTKVYIRLEENGEYKDKCLIFESTYISLTALIIRR